MAIRKVRIIVVLLATLAVHASAEKCDRKPDDTTKPRSTVGGKFRIVVSEYNKTGTTPVTAYEPNTKYSITLQGDQSGGLVQKFTKFLLVAENGDDEDGDTGHFDIDDAAFTKFSHRCPNAVIEGSTLLKESVSVPWVSPMEGAGCILIRATVKESLDVWYMDEGGLTATLCQFSASRLDDPGPVLSTCCACDEAKYEVTFEGLWSKNTHPKDFPSNGWLTRFSDVIGASHTVDYRFWEYAKYASEGLRQVAERGATRMLESELKDEVYLITGEVTNKGTSISSPKFIRHRVQSDNIRTIIKARGITYPNVTGKTFAVFRVDRKHHLMSLVSMIFPSPDWIVGVSGLELCLANCSWIEHRELNLYPFDVGTDSGITYIAPDSATTPREPIRRITSTFPNDPRSPFYDETGMDMKPIAKLYLNRQRLYEKTCDLPGPPEPTEACKVSGWAKWGRCSRTCGRGQKLRQRHYIDPEAAATGNCKRELTSRSKCNVERCPGHSSPPGLTPEMCELDEWSSWSSCTATCGPGIKTKLRKFRHRKYRKYCMHNEDLVLEQQMDCKNEPCDGDDPDAEEVRETTEIEPDYPEEVTVSEEWLQKCPKERFTRWSEWSPCSSSCGPGVMLRSRLIDRSWSHLQDKEEHDLEECKTQQASCEAEIPNCDFSEEIARSICSEPLLVGNCSGRILRVYFDSAANECKWFNYTGCGGNRNNFPFDQECINVCSKYQTEATEGPDLGGLSSGNQVIDDPDGTPVDCELTDWSPWSPCDSDCKGYTYCNRTILQEARNGGKKCPKKLEKKKRCRKVPPCSTRRGMRRRSHSDSPNELNEYSNSVDCEVSVWSPWSSCTVTCGYSVRHRTRNIVTIPDGPDAKLCPSLVQFTTCPTPDCDDSTWQ